MEILEVYDKNNFHLLKYEDYYIKEMMDNFFKKYPRKYKRNYQKNIKDVELYKVDSTLTDARAIYLEDNNLILYEAEDYIIHELMHLSQYDKKNMNMAISRKNGLWEEALIEGCAEYLACKVTGKENYAYIIETFVIDMLSEIDNFFEPFFIPNYQKFINLFKNKRDILTLMCNLDIYHKNSDIDIEQPENDDKVEIIGDSLRKVIDSLISIEVSNDRDYNDRRKYYEKFMLLLERDILKLNFEEFFYDYYDYSNKELKKRILRR